MFSLRPLDFKELRFRGVEHKTCKCMYIYRREQRNWPALFETFLFSAGPFASKAILQVLLSEQIHMQKVYFTV